MIICLLKTTYTVHKIMFTYLFKLAQKIFTCYKAFILMYHANYRVIKLNCYKSVVSKNMCPI